MQITSFKQYLVEEQREIFFTFGRMNPPTIGHGKLMNVMSSKSGKNPYRIYLSQSQDAKKNPLTYQQKVKHVRKMFPKHARSVMMNTKVKTVFDVATVLYDEGFNRITMVVGADRVTEFKTLLEKYNGEKGRHGFYNFEKIAVVSAGDRDPDAEGVEGMSASKQRQNAANNDFMTFSQGIPTSMSSADAKRLFNDVRAGMGLKETTRFKNHVSLETVSELREKYVEGELFAEGDRVVIKSNQKEGYVHRLGANYLIIALDEGRISRQWLENVELQEVTKEKINAQPKKHTDKWYSDQPEWGTPEATKKAKEKVPGQSQAHVHTKSPMKEEVTQQQLNDLEKFADRLLNKFDIDIEFTRHFKDRMNDSRNKPAITVAELQQLFKKIADNKGKRIKKHGNAEAVLKDIQSDLNLPVVVNWKNGEFEVVNKTIMRKKGFKTSNPVVKYESFIAEDEVDLAMDRIQKDKENEKRLDRQEKERKNKQYDRILDRAKIARARRKSRATTTRV